MRESDRVRIEELVGDGLLLDVGGYARPFLRADYVIDIFPYETRCIVADGIGRLPTTCLHRDPLPGERFRKETWIIHDICSGFPFPDKMFDFVVASHVLEDVRDPIRACSEIIRVGRAGYIEVPSRIIEQTMGFEQEGVVGCPRHRWLVEIQDNCLTFRLKPHFLHTHKKYYIPRSFTRTLFPEVQCPFIFWNGSFEYGEIYGYDDYREAEEFVGSLSIPKHLYWLDSLDAYRTKMTRCYRRLRVKIGRLRRGRRYRTEQDLWTRHGLFEANRTLLQKEHPFI